MSKKDRQGTTWEQDKARLKRAFQMEPGDIHHALMNIGVESARRDAQRWVKVYWFIIGLLLCLLGFISVA